MHPERWQSCTDIFNVAVEQPPDERAAFLERSCDGDEALRRKVELLLKYHDAAGDFIKSPAFQVAPELLLGDPEALIGQHLGRYRVDAVAGVGGMGVVYLACDERLDRKVALKLLPQSMVANEAALRRLEREARSASALNHPNIVTVHEIGEINSTHYVATEFIEGTTLRERMTKGSISPNEALDIAAQVASALCVAHRAGIVHRDIKPENIMLRPDGYVKVLDFGIAKLTQQETLDTTPIVGTQLATQQSMFLGTTRYMSPEQAMAQQVDARSDLWGLGVVLYEMLVGRTPFEGETVTDVLAAICESDPQPLKHRAPGVPPALQSVVERSLRKDPAERYQTAEEMLSDLRAVKEKTDGIAALTARWIAVAAVAAMLVGLALFYAWGGGRTVPAQPPAVTEKSVAVLPFENLNKDEENAFLAGGVQDEILTDLAKIADLKVISRTSVMKYKSGLERNLREIAKALGVSHVVEGSVQRAGDRVRVSAQLIDARNDTHVWAEHYDRHFADIFTIQSEIAERIADQLRAKLSVAEKAAIAERPTADLVAYAYYTKAKDIDWRDNWEGREKSLIQKVELLEKAIQRDPNFALAYCELAKTHVDFGYTGIGDAESRKHLELAKKAAEAALRVRPDLGEAHLELASYYFYAFDYNRARDELNIVRRKLPNSAEALMIEALIGRHENRWDVSLANLQKASELDPSNSDVHFQLARVYFEMRRYSECEQFMTKETATGKVEDIRIKWWLAEIKLAQGDPVAAQSLLEQVPLDYSPGDWVWGTRFSAALYLRDYDAANRVIAAIPAKWAETAFSAAGASDWARAQIARARGDKEKALAAFAAARTKLEAKSADTPEDAGYLAEIAKFDAGLGRKEEAIREARRAVDLMPTAKDAVAGPTHVAALALVYAWTGERDRALEQLEKVATVPGVLGGPVPTYGDLRFNPCWDDLRDDPRFDKIVAAAKAASR
jgi:eukaryotic-like serine/threonine-protein kinase